MGKYIYIFPFATLSTLRLRWSRSSGEEQRCYNNFFLLRLACWWGWSRVADSIFCMFFCTREWQLDWLQEWFGEKVVQINRLSIS